MILVPAIDILDGATVRLAQGAFDERKVYDEDPREAAMRWREAGARTLHVVDLDGARAGEPVNLEHVRRIAQATGLPIQVGGGLRDLDSIDRVVQAGARAGRAGYGRLR